MIVVMPAVVMPVVSAPMMVSFSVYLTDIARTHIHRQNQQFAEQ